MPGNEPRAAQLQTSVVTTTGHLAGPAGLAGTSPSGLRCSKEQRADRGSLGDNADGRQLAVSSLRWNARATWVGR